MRSSVLDPRIIPERLSPVSRTLLSLLGSSATQVGPAGHAAKRLGLRCCSSDAGADGPRLHLDVHADALPDAFGHNAEVLG